jgi:nicotinate dehydrogenase subunit B
MTAWGSKGPAGAFDIVAGLDAQGKVTAVQFTSHVFSGNEVNYVPQDAGGFLTAQLMGVSNVPGGDEFSQWGGESAQYDFPNVSSVSHIVPPFTPAGSPLRTAHIRDPGGPMTAFAIESFIDELAHAGGADPVEFRLGYLADPRAKAVIQAAADKAGWDRRPSPKARASGDVATGRGIAFGVRLGSRAATVAQVEVNRSTAAIRVTRLVCAHDCGLIINPDGVRNQIRGNLMQSLSRAMFEEVRFDRTKVTSVDWSTYPVAKAGDVPEIDVVLINHPELASSGAGEPSTRPTAAAINNAIFDAVGVRLRRAPLTPQRLREAIDRAV